MKPIDWSNAPADATHWQPENRILRAAWIKQQDGLTFFKLPELSGGWIRYWGTSAELGALIERPPFWNGEGLPPVGADVEVFVKYSHLRFDRFIGQQVHIVAHDVINGDPVAVFRMPVDGDDTEQDYHAMLAGSFPRIRTPEQIAAEERDSHIAALQKASGGEGLPPITYTHAAALYNAGARMPGEGQKA